MSVRAAMSQRGAVVLAVVVLGGLVGGACGKGGEPRRHDAAPAPKDAAAAIDAPGDAARPAQVYMTGSVRCGECHEKMIDEWRTSAHARAATSPLYVAARTLAGNADCGTRCHAPLVPMLGRADAVAGEGITCDVCHTLRDPRPSPKGSEFRLAINDMVKFGPRCDLDDHYFHRMGCSPEHATAEICGGCHWWERKGVPVFTEYKDWREGPDAAKGVVCQDCHMPGERAMLATGAPVRNGVKHHGLLGVANDLRARAIAVEATVRAGDDGALIVEVAITNTTAGHTIPSGLPERRLTVTVVARIDGAEVAAPPVWLGRVLVDAAGKEVPFWQATKVGADTRIAPGATRTEQVTLRDLGDHAGTVDVEVAWWPMSPAVRTLLDPTVDGGGSQVLAHLTVPFGAVTPTGRKKLPKTVSHVPASPGKRAKPLKSR